MIGGSREVGSIHYSLGLDKSKFDKGHSHITGKLAGLSKKFAIAGAASAAVFGAAFGKFVIGGGISRALNIEDAQAKLKGLGHDVKGIESIMKSALDSVKGTAYGLDEAATISAGAVAAGVESGESLTNYLKVTADTATIAGSSLGEMGAIFNKVQTNQKAYTMELRQLADRGIPIFQWLQEEFDVSAEKLQEMVQAGEVDSETYFKVISKNIGGAALESGKTTRGAWANMQAAMARVGAAIVKDIIPKVRESFGDLTEWFDDNSDKIVEFVGKMVEAFKEFVKKAIEVGKKVFDYLRPKLIALWNTLQEDLIPTLIKLWQEVIEPLLPVLGTLLVGAIGLVIDILNILIGVISSVVDWMLENKETAILLGGILIILAGQMGVFSGAVGIATGVIGGFHGAMVVAHGFLPILQGALAGFSGFAIIGLAAFAAANQVWKAIEAWKELQRINEEVKKSETGEFKASVDYMKSAEKKVASGEWTRQEADEKIRKVTGLSGSAVFGSGTSDTGGFAIGGEAMRNTPYMVGERGPELFIPRSSGQVLSNDEISGMGGGAVSIYGDVNIGNEQDADNFFARLSRNQELSSKGLASMSGSVG